MKIYKMTVMVVDMDDIGGKQAVVELENGRFGNDCICPQVVDCVEADIPDDEFDQHPINFNATWKAAFDKLFDWC